MEWVTQEYYSAMIKLWQQEPRYAVLFVLITVTIVVALVCLGACFGRKKDGQKDK
jgi:hypothetical protein